MLGTTLGAMTAAFLPFTPFDSSYRTRTSALTASDLDVAFAAARWVRAARRETATGITWPADPGQPASVGRDLYNGIPGVVLFHLELYHATHDRVWLDEAKAGAREIIAQLPAMDTAADCGLYTGLGGAAFVLEETHRASGDGRFRDAAARAIASIHANARRVGSGVAWSGESATDDIISGSAGIGLLLLWADRRIKETQNRALAVAAGRRLVEVGRPANGGLKWAMEPDGARLYPNFSHGTAGVAYFLAALHRATGDRAFVDAAVAGAKYLEAVANTEQDGLKVFHHEPGGEDLYYLSWCHGPAGTSRLFYELARTTGDKRWLTSIQRAARAITASGIPEQRTPGFWNNISQCCGNAGVGEYFLTLNRLMPDPAYAEMVSRVRNDTLLRATVAEMQRPPHSRGMKWIQAENRIQPDVIVAQTGFMQGASGVGTFFLHLDAAKTRRAAHAIQWPDSPFA
jgi:lantibiotic modifying enzyme